MNLIETSLRIALDAHQGQTDKAGETYILHPLRIMSRMNNDDERAAALLHDVLEDSNYTAEDLRKHEVSDEVIEAVLCLTKKEGESYDSFVSRAMQNEIARAVKKADLEDNLNMLRLKEINQKDLDRAKKYHSAWNRINNT